MKAYIVREGPLAMVIFAGNSRKAIENYYDQDIEIQGMNEPEAIRKPELDKFADTGVIPAYEMVQAGFRVKCPKCGWPFEKHWSRADYVEFDGQTYCTSCWPDIRCGICIHQEAGDVCGECCSTDAFIKWERK
jgi:hypothetical protein